MSPATLYLLGLALSTALALLIGDWRRRNGRSAPLTRVRTALRRRPHRNADGSDGNGLLAAGFAAQIVGPLLAKAAAAARRADASKARLERALDGERRVRAELASLVSNLGEHYDGVRPTNPRWHRYGFYALVMAIDVATGLVIARGLNLSARESFGFGASAGMFLFFLGKIGGTGLRRLDLGPVRGPRRAAVAPAPDASSPRHLEHPDIGKPWVSVAMIVVSVIGMALFIAGMTASRQVAQGITSAAFRAANAANPGGGAAVALPDVPWWQSALSSGVALGSFAATAFLALRNHPVTRRIEELELRIKRRTREATKAVRPLGSAARASSRVLALLDAAIAELAARLDITADIEAVPAFKTVCADVAHLHGRQQACIDALDRASEAAASIPADDAGERQVDDPEIVLPPAPELIDAHGAEPPVTSSSNGAGR
jgi:hypothetical protein